MAAGDQTPPPFTPPQPLPFPGMWLDYWELADAHGRAVFDWYTTVWDPQAARKRWLESMTEAADAYLRSPAFLEALRIGSIASTDAREAYDRMIRDAVRAWGLPTVSDVDAVAERVRRAERSLASRFDDLEERLDAIDGVRATGSDR